MNELNKVYSAMLLSWGGVIKDSGRIYYLAGGEEHPVSIDEMDLYLPLSEVLDGNTVNKVFFHPACENITSKETEVFKLIRKMTVMNLLTKFRNYPPVLFAISGKEKKGWKQHTLDMLEPIKSAKRTVRAELNKLFQMMTVEIGDDGLDNRFIHFKVTKAGGRNRETGERVYYKTKPVFPFYTEVIKRLARTEGKSDNQLIEFHNVEFSRETLKLAAHIFQQVLPAVNNPDDCEYESTNSVAARLVSYLGCYSEIVAQLNRVQNTFRADFDKAGIFSIEDDWMERLEDLPEIYRQVPVMDYNSHNTTDDLSENERNSIGMDMMSVSSNKFNQPTHVNQPNNYQNNNQNNQNNNQNNVVGDFDLTIPPMQSGDRFLRTEVDYQNMRVLHHAVNTMNNNPVVYQCTRYGNLLQRSESQMNMGMNNMNMGMNNMNMGMNNMNMGMNGMMMLPSGAMVPMGMYNSPAATATATAIDPTLASSGATTW